MPVSMPGPRSLADKLPPGPLQRMIATPKPCLPPDASASDDRAPLQTPRSARLNDDLGAILSARRERLEKKEAEGRRVSFSNKLIS